MCTACIAGAPATECALVELDSTQVYAALKKRNFQDGLSKLKALLHQYKKKVIFCSWLTATRESKKAALFFRVTATSTARWTIISHPPLPQHREHGEEGGEEDQWFYPDGQDPISLLPRKVGIKVSVCVWSGASSHISLCRYSVRWVFGGCVAVHKSAAHGKK